MDSELLFAAGAAADSWTVPMLVERRTAVACV